MITLLTAIATENASKPGLAQHNHIAAHMLGLIEPVFCGRHQVIDPSAFINLSHAYTE
ncbi:MAG: hypothetical protein P8P26_01335 [Porticoccaceae bacterium]|nr:hypothetical protein [Porticoccaceae bacterium]